MQCGSAGHNVRSQPNMNGAPVGRLTLKDTFTASEEVRNKILLRIIYTCNILTCIDKSFVQICQIMSEQISAALCIFGVM